MLTPKKTVLIPEKNRSLIDAKRMTIAILIKLLATNMVANNFLGFKRRFSTMINLLESTFSGDFSSKSVAVSENNATSVPDISAEHNNNTNSITILVIWLTLISDINNKLGGYKSKMLFLV